MKTFLYHMSERMQRQAAQYPMPDMPFADEIEASHDLPYKGWDGNALALNVYRPRNSAGRQLPVIVMIHGGGLYVGDRRIEEGVCCQFCVRGFLTFSIEYRLLTDTDACGEIADVCAGLDEVNRLLPIYGGKRDSVFVAAESAGCYLAVYSLAMQRSADLAAKIGCMPSVLPVQKMACFSGMFYTRRLDLIGAVYPQQIYGKKCFDREFMQYMDPEHPSVLMNLPPALLVSSGADFLKHYTLSYANALQRANRPCRLLYYPDNKELTHAFPAQKPFLKESVEVVDEVTYGFFLVVDEQ